MLGKYALISAMEIQKIQIVVYIFSGLASLTENVSESRGWIPLQVVDLEQDAFWFNNKRVQAKILSIERLAGNNFSERGTQAEAHCERNLNRQLWSRLDEKYCIAVQGILVGINIKASAASLKVTELLFAFAFCTK